MHCPVCNETMQYEEYRDDFQGPIVDQEYFCIPCEISIKDAYGHAWREIKDHRFGYYYTDNEVNKKYAQQCFINLCTYYRTKRTINQGNE